MPRLNGRRRTYAPFAAATSAVRSAEPSSITTMSSPASNARSSSITRVIVCSSLSAGTIATRRSSDKPRSDDVATGRSTISGTGRHRHAESQQLEEPPRSMCVRVLVEDPLARPPSQLLGLRGVREQLAVHRDRLVCVRDDDELAPGLEPPL